MDNDISVSEADSTNSPLGLPSRRHTGANGEYRVGLELTGLTIERIGETLRTAVGGEIRLRSAYEHTVTGSGMGQMAGAWCGLRRSGDFAHISVTNSHYRPHGL